MPQLEIQARGHIRLTEKGKYYLEVKPDNYWAAELSRFEPDTPVVVSVKKWYKKRSLKQNDFYWAIFIEQEIECFKEYWGETFTKQEVHDWNKLNFWGDERVIEATGEIIKSPASSTTQNTFDWEEKLEKARQWFRQSFNWEINYPNEQGDLNFKQ